jgi:hypothetical protein
MTEVQIDKGNIEIMLFDGWEKATRQTFDPDHNGGSNTIHGYKKLDRFVRAEDVEFDIVYHQSWNALMPVVEKIESLGYYFSMVKTDVTITNIEHHSICHCARFETKIMTAWMAIVSFLQWYNKNNNL